jgi:hypothetical protein
MSDQALLDPMGLPRKRAMFELDAIPTDVTVQVRH